MKNEQKQEWDANTVYSLLSLHNPPYMFVLFFQPHMHARISMSELNEREDRSMIAHARGTFYFSLTSFIVGTI